MILLLLAHPNLESFNHALAGNVSRFLNDHKFSVEMVDLYRMVLDENLPKVSPFPAVLEREELLRKTSLHPVVQGQMRLLEKAEGYVVIHPDWWGGPPAVLKGWIDRVLRPETAYTTINEVGETRFEGLLGGRRALVMVTGTGHAGPLKSFWEERVWGFCGVQAHVYYLSLSGKESSPQRQKKLGDSRTILEKWLEAWTDFRAK